MKITAHISHDRDGSGIADLMHYPAPSVEIDEVAHMITISDEECDGCEGAAKLAARLVDAGEIY